MCPVSEIIIDAVEIKAKPREVRWDHGPQGPAISRGNPPRRFVRLLKIQMLDSRFVDVAEKNSPVASPAGWALGRPRP